MLSSDFHCKENDSDFVSGSYPYTHESLPVVMVFMKSGLPFVESIMSWVYGYDPQTKSFRNFPYIGNPTRAFNTTSLKCCCHQLMLLIGEKNSGKRG